MSGGTFNVSRDLWSDAAFQDEPFSEREAWLWMISEAAWKDREKRIGKVVVTLHRGQLAHSTRYLSDTWRWSHAKVRRFLNRVAERDMIVRETGTGVSVISIVKYDTYQFSAKPSGTEAAQKRHSSDTNEKKGIREEGKEEESALSEHMTSQAAEDIPNREKAQKRAEVEAAVTRYNAAAKKAGWPEAKRITPNRSKQIRARMAECGGLDGWEAALVRAFKSDFCRGRSRNPWTGFGLDWLIKAANFTKLMEGNYDNRDREIGGQSPNGQSGYYDAASEIAIAARS